MCPFCGAVCSREFGFCPRCGALLDGTRKAYLAHVTTIRLLIIDDLAVRKLPKTAAEDLLEIIMRRYERASTLLTSNRPVEDWGKLLGDTAAVAAESGAGRPYSLKGANTALASFRSNVSKPSVNQP